MTVKEELIDLLKESTIKPTTLIFKNKDRYPYFTFMRLSRLHKHLFKDLVLGFWFVWVFVALFVIFVPYAWIAFLVVFLIFNYNLVCWSYMFFPRDRNKFVKRTVELECKNGKTYTTTLWQPRYTIGVNECNFMDFEPSANIKYYLD